MYIARFFLKTYKDGEGSYRDEVRKCGPEHIKVSKLDKGPFGPYDKKFSHFGHVVFYVAKSKRPFVLLITRQARGEAFVEQDGQTTVVVGGPAVTKVPVGSGKVYSYYTKLGPGAKSCHGDVKWTQPVMVADGQPIRPILDCGNK